MPLSSDAKKKITYINRRRRPSNVVLLSATSTQADDESCSDSSSSVFVLPMSAQSKPSRQTEPSSFAGESPQGNLGVQSPSFSHSVRNSGGDGGGRGTTGSGSNCFNIARPRSLLLFAANPRNDVAPEPGELSLSTLSTSISVHRRPSQEQPHKSTATERNSKHYSADNDSAEEGVNTVSRPSVKAMPPPPSHYNENASTKNPSLNSTISKTATTVPITVVMASRPARATAPAPTRSVIHTSPRVDTNNDNVGNMGGTCCGFESMNGPSASPELPAIGSRQMSYQSLESPQDAACTSDLGTLSEGVDWERVNADPHELFRQRNIVPEPVVTRQSTKPNNEMSVSCTRNATAPEPTSVVSHHETNTTKRGNNAPSSVITMGCFPEKITLVPSLKQPQALRSYDSPSKPESAQCGSEELTAERVEKAAGAVAEDVTEVGGNDSENISAAQLVTLDTTTPPQEEETESVKARKSSANLKTTKSPVKAAIPPSSENLGEMKESANEKARSPAAAPAPTSAAPKEGDVNVFVAVRLRPCKETGGGTRGGVPATPAGTSGKDVVSCVRADSRRGFVDCSTVVPASVLGSEKNNTGTPLASASSAVGTAGANGATVDKAETAAGKRTCTLRFFFDHIFDEHVAQRDVMEQIGQCAVKRVLAGYHGTVMCYGQSGSGKTYTIVGPKGGKLDKKALRWTTPTINSSVQSLGTSISSVVELSASRGTTTTTRERAPQEHVRIGSEVGLLPRMLQALFTGLEARRLASDNSNQSGSLASWDVTFSALELYNEELRDLLPNALDKKPSKKKRNTSTSAAVTRRGTDGEAGEEGEEETKPPMTLSKASNGRNNTAHNVRNQMVNSASPKKSDVATSPSAFGSAPLTSLPTYPGLFRSHNSAGKTSMEGTRCWNAEDLDVLNAVSSSDDDEANSDIDTENSGEDDEEETDRVEATDNEDASSRHSGSGVRTGNPDITQHALELPPCQRDVDNEDSTVDKEPDPSRPTTNAFAASSEGNTARGRMTIGQLTSVSPSPPQHHSNSPNNNNNGGGNATNTNDLGKKQVVVVVGAKARSNNKVKSTTTNAAATTTSLMQTRVSHRLPSAVITTSKSPSPLQKMQSKTTRNSSGVNAGSSPVTRSSTHTLTLNSTHAYNNNSSGSQLTIRQGQPSTLNVNPQPASELATKNSSSRAASTRSRSATRQRGHVRDTEEEIYIEGLREHPIHDLHEGMQAVRLALHHRQMASTELNSDSSRAHTFFFVKVEQRQWRRCSEKSADEESGSNSAATNGKKSEKLLFDVQRSTLTLVDLAGSERVSHTGAHGLRLKEAQNINLSLSALGNVMRLLSASASASSGAGAGTKDGNNDAHIPYRDSKLTRILQNSLGGNAITFLLCNISPDYRDASETMSTLRFASLSKAVKNKARRKELVTLVDADNGSAVNRSTAGLLEKYRKEQKAALAAVESKLHQLTGDASRMQDRMRQMAAYTSWVEDQLGYFASSWLGGLRANTSAAAGAGGEQQQQQSTVVSEATLQPTVVTLSTSLTNDVGNMRNGDSNNSSMGSLGNKECTACVASATTSTAITEQLEKSAWWVPSPRPPSPPSSSAIPAGAVSANLSNGDQNVKVPNQEDASAPLTSPVTPFQSSPLEFWQSSPMGMLLSPSYSLVERQTEMQRRLVAAAAAAGVGFTFAQRPLQQQVHPPSNTPNSQALSPFTAPTAVAGVEGVPAFFHSLQNSLRNKCCASREQQQEQLYLQQQRDQNVDSRRRNTPSSSGVFVSESSMAEAYSPCLSTLTDGQPTQTQHFLHSPASFQRSYPAGDAASSTLMLSHSGIQPAPPPFASPPSPQPEQQQLQQRSYHPTSDYAVALTEERLAREAAQARLAEIERQNLLLRLRLSSLRLQQRGQEGNEDALTSTPPATTSTGADASVNAAEVIKSAFNSPSPYSDVAPPPLTPSSLPQFCWPPPYSRAFSKISLQTFLARCGFVPLDAAVEPSTCKLLPSVHPVALQQYVQMQTQQLNLLESHLSSPSDARSLRSITVSPSSMQAFREGNARHDDLPWNDVGRATENGTEEGNHEDCLLSNRSSSTAATSITRSTVTSSVLAVVNPFTADSAAHNEHPLPSTPVRLTLHYGKECSNNRSCSHRRARADSLGVSPRAKSPDWTQHLFDNVPTTLEGVRATSSHETCYEPDDFNPIEG